MQFDVKRRARRRAIGLTPLIDVVFILLLFFMLASTLSRLHAVPLVTTGNQDSSIEQPQVQSDTMRLRILADGGLELGGESLALKALAAALSRHADQGTAKLIVTPEASVDLQTLLVVFDEIAAAGVALLRLEWPRLPMAETPKRAEVDAIQPPTSGP